MEKVHMPLATIFNAYNSFQNILYTRVEVGGINSTIIWSQCSSTVHELVVGKIHYPGTRGFPSYPLMNRDERETLCGQPPDCLGRDLNLGPRIHLKVH